MSLRPTNNPKIECRHCGCRMTSVTQTIVFEVTYHGKQRTIIKRHRKCRHCGLQFNTIETYEDDENTNLPEDIQPFRPALPTNGKPGVYKHTPAPSIPKAAGEPLPPPKRGRGLVPYLPPEKPQASRPKRGKSK